MFSTIFYGIASFVLCVMISNATGPAIDYSYLSKPTTTVSFPPVPIPAAALSSSIAQNEYNSLLATAQAKLSGYNLERIIGSSGKNSKRVSSLSFWSWRLSEKKRRDSVPSKATSTSSIGYDYSEEQQQPQRSRYSPPAAYSVEDYEQYTLRHTTSFNRSESGFCGTERIYSQEQDWKTQIPINIPVKP